MNISNVLRRGVNKLGEFVRSPVSTFKGLSSNGKLVVFLGSLLMVTGLISLIYVVSTSSESQQEAITNNDFETQVSTFTALDASVIRVEGNVEYKTASTDWQDADETTVLGTEDEIKTEGAASRVVISYGEGGTELRLDGDTHVRLEASTQEKIETFLLSGTIYNRVGEDSPPYSIESEDAHYESLGTVFIVESTGDRQAIEVIESSIIETQTNNTIDEGNRYTVKSVVDASDSEKVERIDINEYKNDTFVKWNLAIDNAIEDYKNKLGFLQDTDAPTIEISSPKQDEVILTEPSSDTGAVTIKGRANGAIKVQVTAKSINDLPAIDATVDSDGSFSVPAIDSPLGLSVFEIVAADRAGNTATKSLRVTIQRKSAPAEESDETLILLNSAEYNKDDVKLAWTISGDVEKSLLRVLYSKQNSPTLSNAEGVKTPNKDTSYDFEAGGLDKTTYYFRICELDESQSKCNALSNTKPVSIE